MATALKAFRDRIWNLIFGQKSGQNSVRIIAQKYKHPSPSVWLKGFGPKTCFLLLAGLTMFTVIACSSPSVIQPEIEPAAPSSESESLVILWDKGYVTEEDDAIKKVVADWQTQGGKPVKLSFYNSGEIAPKTLRASQAGRPPDVLFAAKSVYPVSDWEGKLADVSKVVLPLVDSYTEDVLLAAKVYGLDKAQDRYYAVPLNQSTTHIYYWKDFLAEAGYTPDDIPTEWDAFWSFWQTVQAKLSHQHPNLRSLGLPYSRQATDTYHIFEHILAAYDIKLLDEQGNLQFNNPDVKAGLVKCLDWYMQFYQEGYVPDSATDWLDPDNNLNLLNRNVVMTPNPTLSIPAAVRNDEEVYFNRLGTVEFPNMPNGNPLPHFVSIRQAVIFKDSPNQVDAQAFLAYLTQPETLSDFLKSSYGRYMPPALSQIQADSFWGNPADPHISTVVQTVVDGQTQPFYNALNPRYGEVMESNIWGRAIHSMAVDGVSASVAADEAISQIKSFFR